MSLKIDRLQLEIIINNDQARKSLRLLDDEARTIQKSMKGMKEGTDEWINATKRLSSIKTQMDNIQDSIGILGMSLKELSAKQKQFNMLVSNLPANSPEYAHYKKTLDEINARITELKGKSKDAGDSMKGMFSNIGPAILKLGTTVAAVFSLDAIKNYVKEGIEAAIKLRDTESLLLEELNGQKSVQTDLINLAKERAGSTMYGRLEIEEAEKFLAIQQRTPEQIKKTIEAATNLAALTGGSLKDSVEILDATMEGRLGKGLGKLEKDFKGLTKEQMYNGEAIDIVAKKYGGLAEREMNTTEGRINLLEKAWKGLRRTLGEVVLDSEGIFSKGISGATTFLNTMKKWFDIPIEKKLADESAKVNLLATQLLDANIPAEKRNALYKELETIAPSITAGLDAENLSYKDLAKNLDVYNNLLINKIILSRGDKKIDDANVSAANARQAVLNQELKIRKELNDYLLYASEHGAKEGGESGAKWLKWISDVKNILADPDMQFADKFTQIGKLARETELQMLVYNKLLSDQESAMKKVNGLLTDKEVLMKQLGLTQDDLSGKDDAARKKAEEDAKAAAEAAKSKLDFAKMSESELHEVVSRAKEDSASNIDRTNSRLAQKELNRREALSKAYEQYMDLMREIADIEKTNFADKLSQTEGEIKAVNEKYNNEIKIIQEYKEHNKKELSPKQTKELDTKIGELEIIRDVQTKQVLEQAEKDFAEKIRLIHENLRVARMTITGREVYDINKKYDELQKEILDAVDYRYRQEVSQAKGNKDKIIEAEKNKAESLAKIQGDLSMLEKARQQETNKARKSSELAFEQDLAALKIKSDTSLAEGKEKIQMQINQKYKKLLDENIGDEKKTNEIKLQMEAEYNAQSAAADDEIWKQKFNKIKGWAEFALNELSGVASAWSSYQNGILQRDEENTNKQKTNLKKQLDSKLITQKQYDAGVAKLDAEADKKKRKIVHDQAVIQKATGVANAIINTAVAITSVLSIPILGVALAIIVGLLGAAQVALILATPIPQASSGRYNVTGKQDGKAYNNVPYQESYTGIPGRPMLVNETGNEIVIDPYTTRNIQMNYPYILEGINQARVPQRASGAYPYSSQRSAAGPMLIQLHPDTLKVLDRLDERLAKPIDATIVYDNLRDSMNTVAMLEKNVSR